MKCGSLYHALKEIEGGSKHFKAKPLLGRPLKINGNELRWIYKAATTKNPLQLKFP
jgi:hypothetical protein